MKQTSDEIILVTSKDQIKSLCSNFSRAQKIQFNCETCNKQTTIRLSCFYGDLERGLACTNCYRKIKMIKNYGSVEAFYKFQQEQRESAVESKYGVKNISSIPEIKQKKREIFKQESVKDKIRQSCKKTCLERYGVEVFRKSEACQESIKRTSLRKYGVTNHSKSPLFKEKARKTFLEKYGVEHPSQSLAFRKTGTSGRYKFENLYFDSKPELAFYIYNKDTGREIEREPTTIEYLYNNEIHTYFPDFSVDGQLFEIKGGHFLNEDGSWQDPYRGQHELLEAKHQAALQNNVIILYPDDYNFYIDYVEKKYGKKYLSTFFEKYSDRIQKKM